MAFCFGEEARHAGSQPNGIPPAAKTDEQTRERRRGKHRDSKRFFRKIRRARRVYGWYEQEKEKRADSPLLLVTCDAAGNRSDCPVVCPSYPKAYYSSSTGPFYYFIRQTMFAAVGLALMYVVSCIPYWKYKRWALHSVCVVHHTADCRFDTARHPAEQFPALAVRLSAV